MKERMESNIKTIMTLLNYGILIWAVISNSIARAIVGIGLMILLALDKGD